MPTLRTLQRSDAEAALARSLPVIDDLAELSIDGSGLKLWRVVSVNADTVLVEPVPSVDDMTTPQLVRELVAIKVRYAAQDDERAGAHARLVDVVGELRQRAVLD